MAQLIVDLFKMIQIQAHKRNLCPWNSPVLHMRIHRLLKAPSVIKPRQGIPARLLAYVLHLLPPLVKIFNKSDRISRVGLPQIDSFPSPRSSKSHPNFHRIVLFACLDRFIQMLICIQICFLNHI